LQISLLLDVSGQNAKNANIHQFEKQIEESE
jgi:hypothetical protein